MNYKRLSYCLNFGKSVAYLIKQGWFRRCRNQSWLLDRSIFLTWCTIPQNKSIWCHVWCCGLSQCLQLPVQKNLSVLSVLLSLAHGCRGEFKFGPILLQNSQVALLKSHNCLMLQYLPSSKIGMSTTEHRFEPYRQAGMCEYTLLGVS